MNIKKNVLYVVIIIIVLSIIPLMVYVLLDNKEVELPKIKNIVLIEANIMLLEISSLNVQMSLYLLKQKQEGFQSNAEYFSKLYDDLFKLHIQYKKYYHDNIFYMTEEKYYIWEN